MSPRTQQDSGGPKPGPTNDEHDVRTTILLQQFYLTLRATQCAIEGDNKSGASSPTFQKINAILDGKMSWQGAYEVEQLQCFLLSGRHLDTEIRRRLNEAQSLELSHVTDLQAQVDDAATWNALADADKRPVLHRLVNDLQWFYTQRFRRRQTAQLLSYRVSTLFLVSFLLILVVLFVQAGYFQATGSAGGTGVSTEPLPSAEPKS